MSTDKEQRVEQILERYGVWVKASPWKIDEGADFELMNIEDSGDGELPITEEEERLLGKLETTSHAKELADIPKTYVPKGGDSDSESPDELHRIEEKLDALRDEIRYLKDEISELRVPSATQIEDSEKSGGYFDDEDDETIALTDDELVHILDSADMTDGIVDEEAEKAEETVEEDTAQSYSAAELDNSDSVTMEPSEIEQANLGGESIVNLDEIEDLSDEDEDFEEITGIGISGTDTAEDAAIEDSTAEQDEDIEAYSIAETTESEVFDEGEEVEIGLDEEKKDEVDEGEAQDVGMEEISLGEFGFDMQMDKTASDLADKTLDAEELPEIENLETDEVDTAAEYDAIGQVADSDVYSENEIIEFSDVNDKVFDESDIEASDGTEPVLGEEGRSNLTEIEVSPESLDEIDELDIAHEKAAGEEGIIEEGPESLDEIDELDIAREEAADEEGIIEEGPESLGEIDELDIAREEAADEEGVIEEGPESLGEIDELGITREEAADEEGVIEEGPESLDETDGLDIIELDDEVSDASDIVVEDGSDRSEDTYKELPGTEEIDLDSLEALASNTETTKTEMLSTTDSVSEEVALPGISSELRDEIKDVLKYMDQLLFSLPEEKVEEFKRSEHFEVYKKIFEELGISK